MMPHSTGMALSYQVTDCLKESKFTQRLMGVKVSLLNFFCCFLRASFAGLSGALIAAKGAAENITISLLTSF